MSEPISREPITHPSLLLRVRNSEDNPAWNEFVAVYGPVIFKYCRLRQLQDCDAKDVTQEVLVRLSSALRQFEYKPELGRFRDWLGIVTHREMLKFWRRNRPHQNLQSVQTDCSFEGEAQEPSLWNDHFHAEILRVSLESIEAEFSDDVWRAFHLTWIDGNEASQVSERLGMNIEKVYVAKSRVLKRLREEVLRLSEDLPVPER